MASNRPFELTFYASKRFQVRKACAECRKAHAACTNERPCSRCISKGVECTNSTIGKRKQRASSPEPAEFLLFAQKQKIESPAFLQESTFLPTPNAVSNLIENAPLPMGPSPLEETNFDPELLALLANTYDECLIPSLAAEAPEAPEPLEAPVPAFPTISTIYGLPWTLDSHSSAQAPNLGMQEKYQLDLDAYLLSASPFTYGEPSLMQVMDNSVARLAV